MRKVLFIIVLLAAAIPAGYSVWMDVELKAWAALDSDYSEYPGVSAPEQDYIWGRFPTSYVQLSLQMQIVDRFYIRAGGQYGVIHPGTMFLDSITNTVAIHGSLWGFHTDAVYRLGERDEEYLDVYLGFLYTSAVKYLGSSGAYRIRLFGPQLGVKARGLFTEHFGYYADFFTSPHFENNSDISGIAPSLIEESAAGFRYGFDAAFLWEFDWFSFRVGLKYEKINYYSGQFATHSLDIRYAGPYLALHWGLQRPTDHPVSDYQQ